MRLTWSAEQRDPKKHFIRRKWLGWRPASEGQFSDLLDPGSWDSMDTVEQDISRAGKIGAMRGWARSHAPFRRLRKKSDPTQKITAD